MTENSEMSESDRGRAVPTSRTSPLPPGRQGTAHLEMKSDADIADVEVAGGAVVTQVEVKGLKYPRPEDGDWRAFFAGLTVRATARSFVIVTLRNQSGEIQPFGVTLYLRNETAVASPSPAKSAEPSGPQPSHPSSTHRGFSLPIPSAQKMTVIGGNASPSKRTTPPVAGSAVGSQKILPSLGPQAKPNVIRRQAPGEGRDPKAKPPFDPYIGSMILLYLEKGVMVAHGSYPLLTSKFDGVREILGPELSTELLGAIRAKRPMPKEKASGIARQLRFAMLSPKASPQDKAEALAKKEES